MYTTYDLGRTANLFRIQNEIYGTSYSWTPVWKANIYVIAETLP